MPWSSSWAVGNPLCALPKTSNIWKVLVNSLMHLFGWLKCIDWISYKCQNWWFDVCIVYRNECACNPVRYFAILSMQRSGSGWFETLLNSHINLSSNGEIFSVEDRRRNVSSILKNMDKVYNLDWFSSASKNQCSAAVGFKWMLNQVS